MEEKRLYFEPEVSGDKKHKKEKTKKKNHKFLKLFFFLSFLLIMILIIIWLLKGTKTVSGNYPENVKNESLVCRASGISLSKITSIDSIDKQIRINAIFKGSDSLRSLALEYTLTYSSDNEAYGAEAKSHAELNKSLVASNLKTDEFDNKFARYGNKLIISLFANEDELNEISAPYFMISLDDSRKVPESIDGLKKSYESQGFSCQTTLE